MRIFDCSADSWQGAAWLLSVLDELRAERDGDARGESLFHDRQSIVRAWHEHRVFGLCVDDDYLSCTHRGRGGDAAFFLDRKTAGPYVLPVFCVVDTPCPTALDDVCRINEVEGTSIEYLWVAARVRGAGVGRRMVAETNAYSVIEPIESAYGFWSKMGYAP